MCFQLVYFVVLKFKAQFCSYALDGANTFRVKYDYFIIIII